jgi:hypothetical protein
LTTLAAWLRPGVVLIPGATVFGSEKLYSGRGIKYPSACREWCSAKSGPKDEIPKYSVACCGDRNFEDFAFIERLNLTRLYPFARQKRAGKLS